MTRLKDLLYKTEFHVFLLCFFFLLFNWPLLTLIEKASPRAGFLYLYLGWTVLVAVLALVARQCRNASRQGSQEETPRQ